MSDWPQDLTPQRSSVHVRNELAMSAPCEAVWDVLTEAAEWPSWYSHCKNVRIEGGGVRLTPGARFRWSTNGQPLRSRVLTFAPCERLSWDAVNPLIRVHHTWGFEATPEGCRVVTEETQRGVLPWSTRPITRRVMLRVHQQWLEGLAARAAERAHGAAI